MTPPDSTAITHPTLVLRPVETVEEYAACVAIQEETWGDEFGPLVPPSILRTANRIGGVTLGAFDETGALLGFVFGLAGVEDGRLIHWSDMLAVRPEARNLGIGHRLKELQRQVLAARGVEVIYWSYDPLVARNAHLNLGKLGARVHEYVEEMYPETGTRDDGFGSDRFVVAWPVERPAGENGRGNVPDGEERSRFSEAPVVNPGGADPGVLPDGPARVEVPRDIATLRREAPEEAARWRRSTRKAFQGLFRKGYGVDGFSGDDEGRFFYHLSPDGRSRGA